MKEQWSISKEKLASLEEGQIETGEFTFAKPSGNGICQPLIQSVKLILYLQLILFVGWAGYTILQPYRVQSMEVKVAGTTPKSEGSFDQETMRETDATKSTELNDNQLFLTKLENILTKSILTQQKALKNSHDAFAKDEADDVINAAQNTDSEIDLIRVPMSNTNSDNAFMAQTTVLPFVSMIEVQDATETTLEETVETDESKEKENVMVWTFPFQWSIHGLGDRVLVDDADESENKEIVETQAVTEKCRECDDMNNEEWDHFTNYDANESENKEIVETPAVTEKCRDCDDMNNEEWDHFTNYDAMPVYDDLSINEEKSDQEKSDFDEEIDYTEDLVGIIVDMGDTPYLKFVSRVELFGMEK